jgi:ADP-ribose pyrophosphatase
MLFRIKKFFVVVVFLALFNNAFSEETNKINVNDKLRETRIKEYLDLIKTNDNVGKTADHKSGEIEIVTDSELIKKIEDEMIAKGIKNGLTENQAKEAYSVGIVSKDEYWYLLRDAVIFPSKTYGTYNRLIWKSSLERSPGRVGILPIFPNGRVVLIINYRHPTRSWELDLPRGVQYKGESIEQAACRQLQEETGLLVTSCSLLGEIAPDSSSLSVVMPIYLGKIGFSAKPKRNNSEAIFCVLTFSKEELKEAIKQGYINREIKGVMQKIPVRDSHLIYAIFQAELKGLI